MTIEERLTTTEEKVERMEADAKIHFAELRHFMTEQITLLETRLGATLDARLEALLGWKLRWLIALVLASLTLSAGQLVLTIRG